jgi:hypothetical protein
MSTISHRLAAARRVRGPARVGRFFALCLTVAAASALTGAGPACLSSARASTYVGTSFSKYLWTDQYIGNDGYRFIMQNDGNLVLYNGAGRACWASNTSGRSAVYAKYSGDWVLTQGPISIADRPTRHQRAAQVVRAVGADPAFPHQREPQQPRRGLDRLPEVRQLLTG